MIRCPNCGMDVSPALGVCGVCQTKLEGGQAAAAAAAGASASANAETPGARRAKIAKIGIVFMLAWPLLSLAIGLSPLTIFLVWLVAAIAFGALGGGGLTPTPVAKTISAPVFGELTSPRWEAGKSSLWYGAVRTAVGAEPVEVLVFAKDGGPTEQQTAQLAALLKAFPDRHAAALAAIGKLDRTDWPPTAREAMPTLAAIELDDDEEELADGAFTLRFESSADPEGTYYVDFRHDGIEEAYRVG